MSEVDMKTPSSQGRCATTFFGTIVGMSILFGLSSIVVSPAAAQRPEIAKTQAAWRQSLLRLPRPKTGCYTSTSPRVEWNPVPCGVPPRYPLQPARGHARHFVVGGGGANDYAANPTGHISAVEGSFPNISAGLNESGPIANAGAAIANAYTLQVNTNFFASTACAGSPNPNCKGWEQFIYENNNASHRVFIQYWLIAYNTACPAGGWQQFGFTGDPTIYCFQSTPTASLPAGQPVSNFGNVTLAAAVSTTSDQVIVTAGPDAATRVGVNAVAAAAGWTDAEFNVFGDAGSSAGGGQAAFGINSTIVVKLAVHNGTKDVPVCQTESFTGETNNLTLVGTAAIPTQASPTVEFTQSNVPGTLAGCAVAAGIGDTHLSTFNGLLYDFQASGDFVLAQTDSNFIVQTRQVSGAPTWPDASVNQAVATRMGQTRVAVCTAPSRLKVDGTATEIADGKILSLPSGVDILRTGNIYIVADQSGNSMRAEVNATYINVSVGLGRWPATVRGILANANGHVNEIQARTGTVLTNPFPFDKLYHEYADSWRVSAKDSLLSACGDREGQGGIPNKPFYANDLDPQIAKRARAVCTAAGVRVRALLDACTLDVAVIGRETAAKVFVGMRAPAAVGRVVSIAGPARR
jgi:hypothetical protein